MKYSLAGKSILIVEDYAAMRKAIRDMLYSLSADTIFEADSGASAISAMSKNNFDVVLCDYQLGDGKNGQQVLEEARHRKLIGPQCIFFIISATQAASMVLGVMDGKPDEYLTKPFNAQQLSSRLQKHFAQKHYLYSVEREMQIGNLQKAIQNCERLLNAEDKKHHSQLLKLRAELAINTGDFATARKIYQEVLAQRELTWAKLGLGIIEYQTNKFEEAVIIFEKLLHEHPMFLEAYDWLTKAYEQLNKLDDAQTILFQAVDLSPQSILRQKKLASTAEKNGNLEVAEKAYRATVHLGKHSIHKSCSDFAGLAKLYSKTNANDAALQTLEKMRSEFANNSEAELRAATLEAEVYRSLGKEELSAQAFQKVLSLNQRLGEKIPKDLQLDIVKACFLSEERDKAEEILQGLIKSNIDDDAFLNDMRRMQSGLGMDNHSEIFIQKTKQMLIATNNRGVALYKEGKYHEALELLQQAADSMPDNKTIILNMLQIIVHDLKNGDFSEDKMHRAQALFKKAQQIGIEAHKLGYLKMQFIELSQLRQKVGKPS